MVNKTLMMVGIFGGDGFRSAHRQIVDQARLAEARGGQQPGGGAKSGQPFEAVGVGERDIIDAVEAARQDRGSCSGARLVDGSAARARQIAAASCWERVCQDL